MNSKTKVCKKGLWDETIPGITFNEEGISNYATLFDRLIEAYPRGEIGTRKWLKLVDDIKSSGINKKYDCVIGVSGGTDSSFLLHIAKEYGLKPIAVNLDNGWNSDVSVKNIKKMTQILDIDLETYVIDYEEVKDLLRSYMFAGLPWIDMPTDLAIKAILYKIASREGIKYILRGNDFRSEGSQPTEWTYGDGKQLKAIHKKFGQEKLKTFPNYTLWNLVYYGYIKGIKSIYPFYYLDYNKNKAQEFLTRNYGWEYYGGHHFENTFTRFVISYWLYEKFNIDKRKITLSAQVLSGEINRNEGLTEISRKPYNDHEMNQMIDYVLKKLDLSNEQFHSLMNGKNKSFKDYPSNFKLISRFIKYTRPFLNLIFIHKPQALYKLEVINE